jgi:hypothetical protein
MEVNGQLHVPAALSLGTNPVTYFIGDWVGPRDGLDVLKNKGLTCPCWHSKLG